MHFEKFYALAGRKYFCEGVSETSSPFYQRLSFFSVLSQRFLPWLRTKEHFENGKSSQWAAHVTEKEQELTPGISYVLIQYLFSAKPVGAVIISVCYFTEKTHQRRVEAGAGFACWLTCGSQPHVCG